MPAEREAAGAWERLRRRKVVQWGLAYAAGAWALLQVFGFAADSFGWSPVAKQVAMLGLALGLPVAVVLAWYHGERGEQRATGPEIAIVTLLFLVGGAVLWRFDRHAKRPAVPAAGTGNPVARPPVADAKSVAVLPFVNMSSDPEQEYFSDGMAEQVLNQLSRIPELRVIARTSSFAFRNEEADVATIAERLGVSHVLEGSVRKSGKRLRITAKLIRAADGSQEWSEAYDRELTDVFAIQDEIATAVVRRLQGTLRDGRLPARTTTANLDAYNLYLQGLHLYDRHGREDMERARDLYLAALALDPSFAPAWAALAEATWVLADLGYADVSSGAREARAAARRALELDPRLALAHSVTGHLQFAHDWDWPAAEASIRAALDCDPGDSGATLHSGFLALGTGRRDAAIARFQRAASLSPISPAPHKWLSYAYAVSGRLDEAEREIQAALTLSPGLSTGWYHAGLVRLQRREPEAALEAMQQESSEPWRLPGLAMAYHALGRQSESDAALEAAVAGYGDSFAYQIAEATAYRGDADEAFAWLERAYRQRDAGLAYYLKTDPLLRNLTNDARYVQLLGRMRLLED